MTGILSSVNSMQNILLKLAKMYTTVLKHTVKV